MSHHYHAILAAQIPNPTITQVSCQPYCSLYTKTDRASYTHYSIRLLPLRSLPLNLIVLTRMKHNLVRVSRSHPRMALRPIVRDGIREDGAGTVEACCRHWAWGGFESYEGEGDKDKYQDY